jgi:hypothetical protein
MVWLAILIVSTNAIPAFPNIAALLLAPSPLQPLEGLSLTLSGTPRNS